MKKPKTIEVEAKENAGTHPEFGSIVKGKKYRIPEEPFPGQLFKRPAKPSSTRAAGDKGKK